MNPQSDLEKAIKHGEIARDALVAGSDAYKCLDELIVAAKRLKELEEQNKSIRERLLKYEPKI